MSRRRLTLITALGAALVVAGALTGCATGASSSPATPAPATADPDAATPAPTSDVRAAWVDAGRAVAVVTWGSSSCPPVADGDASVSGATLTVALAESARTDCTRDMAPRATLVPLPAGVDPTGRLTVSVSGVLEGETTLAGLSSAPVTGEEFAPSAGWVDDSLVAIVTYGSSSCPPVVDAVTAGGSDIAVQFATPPADQVCTMDFVPRVTLADVGSVAGDGEVSLVLSGGTANAPAPIPVLGSR